MTDYGTFSTYIAGFAAIWITGYGSGLVVAWLRKLQNVA